MNNKPITEKKKKSKLLCRSRKILQYDRQIRQIPFQQLCFVLSELVAVGHVKQLKINQGR